jgi:phosphoenolpyruvate synthase/pyruvate phosphate dikinase
MIGHPLGQGQPTGTGAKAYHLDLALQKGLQVPEGVAYVVDSLKPSFLQALQEEITKELPGGTYAVRSSFRGEDSAEASQAGIYDTVLFVAIADIQKAFETVYNSAGSEHRGPQGIVVQRMVDAETAGVMFCQPDFLDPLVSWVKGTAEKLVGGEVSGTTQELGPQSLGALQRLRSLAEDVKSRLGCKGLGWDLEWADDGKVSWLVQARPITRAPQRDELFSYANIREIMPDPPSVFMASVVEKAGLTLYEYYRNFDPNLPKNRPIIELQLGRPLFNISLLCETMRHWGLPTRLVTDQIGGADIAQAKFDPQRFLSKWKPIAKQGLSQFRAVGMTRRAIVKLRKWQPADNFGQLGEQVVELFSTLVTVMLDLTAAMAVPLTLLRKLDVLSEHSAQHQTPTGQILRALEPLRARVAQHPDWQETLAQGEAPRDPVFQKPWQGYLESHGHRGFFESDLAQPRFKEVPETILRSLTAPSLSPVPPPPTIKGRLTLPLWLYTQRILNVREHWRNEAMKVYQRLRERILEMSAYQGFSEPNSIFSLSIAEWRQLDEGWIPDDKFWSQREAEIEELKQYNVPDLFRRFHPRHHFLETEDDSELDRRVSGLSLTKGTVEGRVWLAKDARDIPDFDHEQPVVLVVRTVDPGWLFSLPKLAGAIVELGGDLSHGSILLREFGIPAITNAAGATRVFQTGDQVKLVAHEGFAVRLSR